MRIRQVRFFRLGFHFFSLVSHSWNCFLELFHRFILSVCCVLIETYFYNFLQLLKEEIDSQTRSVTNCLDQVRQVVATGSEYLSRDEINNLEKKGKQLRTRFDRANERTDKLLRRLTAARDELTKFKNDLTIFTTWMEKAQRILEEKERSLSNLNRIDGSLESVRDFVSDVIAHQADLRFITMAAQKFVDESKEYLTCLNEFRTSLPQRLPHIEPISAQDSVVRNTVANVSSHYRDLLARVNALSDKLSGLGSKQKEYREALNAAKAWLREVEPKAHKVSRSVAKIKGLGFFVEFNSKLDAFLL